MNHPVNQRHVDDRTFGERISDVVTSFSGTWTFVGLHVVWWTFWFSTRIVEGPPWGNLTMLLSLEAILLATLVLMSQNRQAKKDRDVLEHTFDDTEQLLREIRANTALTLAVVRHLGLDVDELLAEHAVQVPAVSE